MASPPNVVMPLPPGCLELVIPYFQVVWRFEQQPTTETFRIEAFNAAGRLAVKDLGVP